MMEEKQEQLRGLTFEKLRELCTEKRIKVHGKSKEEMVEALSKVEDLRLGDIIPTVRAGGGTGDAQVLTGQLMEMMLQMQREQRQWIEMQQGKQQRWMELQEKRHVATTDHKMKLPRPTLQKLTADNDIESYLHNVMFERVAVQQKWPKDAWATQLAGLLTGDALDVFTSVPTAESSKYEVVKAAILCRFEVNAETYRQRFRKDAKKPHMPAVIIQTDAERETTEHRPAIEAASELVESNSTQADPRNKIEADGSGNTYASLQVTPEQLKIWKESDPSLRKLREAANNPQEEGFTATFFFFKDGLLYRRWIPKGISKKSVHLREQLVLPVQCRSTILRIGHDVPAAGHMGVNKTRSRVLRCYYWPGVFQDIARYCKTCEVCQRSSGRSHKARMIPMPIVTTPFQRIVMDIINWSTPEDKVRK